uniref:Uncharacterized protein n=1 Tax=Meloidogyne javanica TaxID=6303 RepID=A0A915M7D3_MELJA
MLKAASMFYSMIPFIILLCSFIQNCGATQAAVGGLHVAPLNTFTHSKGQLGSSHVNRVSFPIKQSSSKAGIGLPVSGLKQPVLHAQAKQGSQNLFRNGKNHDENGMFNFSEHNSELSHKEMEKDNVVDLVDIEERDKYIEEQKELYAKTNGKEGFDLDKISKKRLDKGHGKN